MKAKNRMWFTHDFLPNLHLEIHPNGVTAWVSLNIEPKMKKYLSGNNIFKGDKMWIYALRKEVENLNFKNLEAVYNELMTRAMINCREAKKCVLDEEINILMNKN